MEIYRAEGQHLNNREVYEIGLRFKKGEIGILPTDTVYTIATLLSNKIGIERICKLAGKKPHQANLSIICSSFEMISHFTLPYPTTIYRKMKQVLPGPYTFIMRADTHVTKFYENKRKEVGVRFPNVYLLLDLVNELSEPLICTSLHKDDGWNGYYKETENIEVDFMHKIDFFIESGEGGDEPSTVVDCTGDSPILIREGKGEWSQ